MENQKFDRLDGFTAAPAEYFTGVAWFKGLVITDENTNCMITEVLFEPQARNNWHTHGSNQILIVKKGIGYYQEDGFPIQEIKVGDVVNVLPGIRHWHGASKDSDFIHLAINLNTEKGIVDWLEPVSDEQYFEKK
jgi:quercetin dioxygenase-like cupin family protein